MAKRKNEEVDDLEAMDDEAEMEEDDDDEEEEDDEVEDVVKKVRVYKKKVKPIPEVEEVSRETIESEILALKTRLETINKEERAENFMKEIPARLERIEKALGSHEAWIRKLHATQTQINSNFEVLMKSQ